MSMLRVRVCSGVVYWGSQRTGRIETLKYIQFYKQIGALFTVCCCHGVYLYHFSQL